MNYMSLFFFFEKRISKINGFSLLLFPCEGVTAKILKFDTSEDVKTISKKGRG